MVRAVAMALWSILVLGMSVNLFILTYNVRSLERELFQIQHTIRFTQEGIHVLTAEWNLLNHPARLHQLARQHLGMATLDPQQMTVEAALSTVLESLERSSHLPLAQQNIPSSSFRHGARSELPEAMNGDCQ